MQNHQFKLRFENNFNTYANILLLDTSFDLDAAYKNFVSSTPKLN